MSYIKHNSLVLATICKRSHVDKMNGAPVGPFRVCIDKKNNPVDYIKMYTCLYGNAFNDPQRKKKCMKANFKMLLNSANAWLKLRIF